MVVSHGAQKSKSDCFNNSIFFVLQKYKNQISGVDPDLCSRCKCISHSHKIDNLSLCTRISILHLTTTNCNLISHSFQWRGKFTIESCTGLAQWFQNGGGWTASEARCDGGLGGFSLENLLRQRPLEHRKTSFQKKANGNLESSIIIPRWLLYVHF